MRRARGTWFVALTVVGQSGCFEWSADSSRFPNIDRRAIAGIWKLTPIPAVTIPMKEFTTFPKKPQPALPPSTEELLLMLKEDGSFQQCTGVGAHDNDEEEDLDISTSWVKFRTKEKLKEMKLSERQLVDLVKGRWDYRDGKLILAADRPDVNIKKSYDEPKSISSASTTKEVTDMLLEGKLVATYRTKLQENPSLIASSTKDNKASTGRDLISPTDDTGDSSTNSTTTSSLTLKSSSLDTHLSVPKGSIKIGKFFYPKNHPSFFEQPMFQPIKRGAFALNQVLGTLNTALDTENKNIEKFKRTDFYNKTFLLTTQPLGLGPKRNAGMRWSEKFNMYVRETLPSSEKKNPNADDDDETKPVSLIRVMQIKFFPNNTFASTGGLGRDVILRGKYDIIGEKKDHLWFQVMRFGFGRSKSGSVYSEGRMLTHDDAKAYWGEISTQQDEQNSSVDSRMKSSEALPSSTNSNSTDLLSTRMEVQGSVLDGWGLEPIPVARFIMREYDDEDDSIDDEDEEDDDDDDNDEVSSNKSNDNIGPDVDGVDWSRGDDSIFQ